MLFFKGKDKEDDIEGDWKKMLLNMNFLSIDKIKIKSLLKCVKWI